MGLEKPTTTTPKSIKCSIKSTVKLQHHVFHLLLIVFQKIVFSSSGCVVSTIVAHFNISAAFPVFCRAFDKLMNEFRNIVTSNVGRSSLNDFTVPMNRNTSFFVHAFIPFILIRYNSFINWFYREKKCGPSYIANKSLLAGWFISAEILIYWWIRFRKSNQIKFLEIRKFTESNFLESSRDVKCSIMNAKVLNSHISVH